MLALPMTVAVVGTCIERRREFKRLIVPSLVLFVCWSLFPAVVACYNYTFFGSPLITGYSLSGEQSAFSLTVLWTDLTQLLRSLDEGPFTVVFAIGLVGMIAVGPWTDRLMRLLWFLPVFIIYGSYYWFFRNWAYSRFFIATIPLMVGSAYLLIDRIRAHSAAKYAAMMLLILLTLANSRDKFKDSVEGRLYGGDQRQVAEVARMIVKHVHPDAVLFSTGMMSNYLGTRESFALYNLDSFSRDRMLRTFKPWHKKNDKDKPPDRPHSRRRDENLDPRQQPARVDRFLDFYSSKSDSDLAQLEVELVRSCMDRNRQVVFFVNEWEMQRQAEIMGKGYVFKPLTSNRSPGLYEVCVAENADTNQPPSVAQP